MNYNNIIWYSGSLIGHWYLEYSEKGMFLYVNFLLWILFKNKQYNFVILGYSQIFEPCLKVYTHFSKIYQIKIKIIYRQL